MVQRLILHTASAGAPGSIPVCPHREKRREREAALRLQNTLLDYNEAAEIVAGISVEDS